MFYHLNCHALLSRVEAIVVEATHVADGDGRIRDVGQRLGRRLDGRNDRVARPVVAHVDQQKEAEAEAGREGREPDELVAGRGFTVRSKILDSVDGAGRTKLVELLQFQFHFEKNYQLPENFKTTNLTWLLWMR